MFLLGVDFSNRVRVCVGRPGLLLLLCITMQLYVRVKDTTTKKWIKFNSDIFIDVENGWISLIFVFKINFHVVSLTNWKVLNESGYVFRYVGKKIKITILNLNKLLIIVFRDTCLVFHIIVLVNNLFFSLQINSFLFVVSMVAVSGGLVTYCFATIAKKCSLEHYNNLFVFITITD